MKTELNGQVYHIKTNFDNLQHAREIVIAAHGVGSSKDGKTQTALLDNLREYNIGVLSFDLLGFGEDQTKGEILIEDFLTQIKDIEDYARSFNKPVSLFGSSFGGYLMMQHAKHSANPYKGVFLRSPALNLYKLAEEIVKQKSGKPFEDFLQNNEAIVFDGLTVTPKVYDSMKRNNNMQAGNSYIIYGTCDDVVDITCYHQVKGAKLLPISDVGHSFDKYALKSMTDTIVESLGAQNSRIIRGQGI